MNNVKIAAKDIFSFTAFGLSLAGVFYFNTSLYNYLATAIAIVIVGLLSLNRRENHPIILFVVVIQATTFALNFLPPDLLLLRLTASSLLDLVLAFLIVHYHNDPALYRLFRVVEPTKPVPQVYLFSIVLAFSSLFSFLVACEIMFYFLDENFFEGKVPFFISVSEPVRLILKVLFDAAIWSLILEPPRWKFLRKIEQRFDL